MFIADNLIFVAAVLLLVGIASSKLASRFGFPVLLLFLGIGMLAGSEGIGGIAFDNYELANGLATVALAIILFDGGLRTPIASFQSAWKPALSLATLGVAITAGITGVVAAWFLEIPLLYGLLLGSIAGSTDAAAVFSVLRSYGLNLRKRIAATLEVESGSNDPMAVFLTIAILQLLTTEGQSWTSLIPFFFLQAGVGGAVGYGVGRLGSWVVNRVDLSAAGLYPILITSFGLLAYGLSAVAGGSGFLSVYIAGIVIGNRPAVFKNGILLFHDGTAWLAQIALFTMLGMLSFPSRLPDASGAGILVTLVLFFVARPIAVFVSTLGAGFSFKEIIFLSWVGLKGAVPIVLASYPLIFGLPGSAVIFDMIFFVVLVSALTQGWTLPWLARRLELEEPRESIAPVTLEITSLRHVEGDIVEYSVANTSRAANRLVRELALPEDAVVAMIARENKIIPPRGGTGILPGDHVFVVLRSEVRPLVDRAFALVGETPVDMPVLVEFPIQANTRVGKLKEFYDISLDAPAEMSLADLLQSRLGEKGIRVGASIIMGEIRLSVRVMAANGRIEQVGLALLGG
jgi:potassium/hydrogen antiporter